MEAIIYLLLICIIWSLYYISIYIYYKRQSLKVSNYDNLMVVQHQCYSFNAKHIYLVKLSYGKSRKKFFFMAKMVLEFIDEEGRPLISIKVPPMVLFESKQEHFKEGSKAKAKLLAFLLQTRISLTLAEEVRISHDSKTGDLFIYEVKIIDLVTKDSFVSLVQSWIRYINPGTHPRAQIFGITCPGRNITDIKPSPYLRFPETVLFGISGIHYILFHTQYNINSTKIWIFGTRYDDTTTMILTAFMAALFAYILDLGFISVYFWIIKRNFSRLKGIGFIWILRFAYLLFIIVMSFVFALTAAFKSQDDEYYSTDSQWSPSTLKWFAIVIGIVIFSLAFFSTTLCIQFCGFCADREDYELRSENDKSYKSVRTDDQQTIKTDSNKSIEAGPITSSGGTLTTDRNVRTQSRRSVLTGVDSNLENNP